MAERGRPRVFDRSAALRSAMDQFWTYGYEGTSIKHLTQAMGINPPSLYAAFGSKEQLFREAIALYAATDGAVTEHALRALTSARTAIETMLRGNAELYMGPECPGGCMFVLAATNVSADNGLIHDYLVEQRRETVSSIERRLDQAVADGELPAGTDVSGLAGFYGTVLHGISIEARDGVSRERLHAIVDSAMRAWDVLVAA
ncbi:TetR/AcrR family transcriptional regulator [Phytoactinopolyspora limicola]|uniref:TetR/AcrR family transcriptional regulator n=1 Tax=Phytoactinopolyspora limicola TaxID=2715536 RepID=UPI00140E5E61|nr:TetR/AcrR family transcriptional regulator [Phytoactinopolyspora limicola]